jgi:hypothetical protein
MTTDIADSAAAGSIRPGRDAGSDPLRDLGVRPDTLSADQRERLDRDGFLLLPAHLPSADLARLREIHDRLMREKYGDAPSGPPTSNDFWFHEAGTRRLNDLLSEGELFERMAVDPLLLAATHRLMCGPFKHDSINAREALPGGGAQGLHRDSPRPPEGGCVGVNSAWLLDAFTPENGPTRVVPGSHLWAEDAHRAMPDPTAAHPCEVQITAPAGSVLIFSGCLWHSGTLNRTSEPRRVVHISFRPRDADLGARAQRLRIRKATWDRLSPAARWLMDV